MTDLYRTPGVPTPEKAGNPSEAALASHGEGAGGTVGVVGVERPCLRCPELLEGGVVLQVGGRVSETARKGERASRPLALPQPWGADNAVGTE